MSSGCLATLRTLRRRMAIQYGYTLGYGSGTTNMVGPWSGTYAYVYDASAVHGYGRLPSAYAHQQTGLEPDELWDYWFGN